MRFAERVSHALTSDDLTMQLERGCDADVLVALGWAAQREPLGSALLRLTLTGDSSALEGAVLEAQRESEAIRRRWKLPKGDGFWRRFAEAGVSYWISSVCKRCRGRMYDVVKGTPKLSTIRCSACRGTGRRLYPRVASESMESDFWRGRFSELLNGLDAKVERTLRHTRHVLTRREVRPE